MTATVGKRPLRRKDDMLTGWWWIATQLMVIVFATGAARAAGPAQGLPEALRALIDKGEPACVAMDAGGRVVLSIEGGRLRHFDRSTKPERTEPYVGMRPETDVALRDHATDPTMSALIARGRWRPCIRVAARDGALVIPKPLPIQIDASGVHVAGNAPVPIHDGGLDPKVTAAYWSSEVGTVFVRLEALDAPWVQAVAPYELGDSACVPRPRLRPAPPYAPRPLDPRTTSACVAMSADGTQAAIVSATLDEGGEGGRTLQWLGRTPAPPIDLACLARRCSDVDLARITREAAALGLVACPETKALTLGGHAAPLVPKPHELHLDLPSGTRRIYRHAYTYEGVMTETEAIARMWQIPDGPLFMQVRFSDQWEHGTRAKVLPLDAMGLCPAEPPEVVPVLAVTASSEREAALGYRWPATAIADGERGTAWRPDPKQPDGWIELTFAASEVVALDVANGEQRRDGQGDRHDADPQARAPAATLTFADGSQEAIVLDPSARGFQRITLATPRTTTSVRIGLTGPGRALSEVRIIRRGAAAPF